MTEREKLIQKLSELCDRFSTDDIEFITGLIIADRRRVLEEAENILQQKEVLAYMKVAEALSKISELKG